jgi:predicted RecB family endonuclease
MYIKTKNVRTGKRYEYYIAWLLRKEGWDVQNRGKYGFYDRGIDLVATKNGKTRYIQCKGWSLRKSIHEDVVTQLYGSVASLAGTGQLNGVEMYIYTPATPTDYAKDKAAKLGINFVRQNFPIWKRKRNFTQRT